MKKISSDLEIIGEVASVRGLRVLDVGCGLGRLVHALEHAGAAVVGLESLPMLPEVAGARRAAGSLLAVCDGQMLGIRSDAIDLVIFMASFHHVPRCLMTSALGEVRRVLKPTGRLLVVEPVAEPGSYFELIRLVEDEREVQALAQAALASADRVGLSRIDGWLVYFERSLSDFAGLVTTYVTDGKERRRILEAARLRTAEMAGRVQRTPESMHFRSICRVEVLAPAPARAQITAPDTCA